MTRPAGWWTCLECEAHVSWCDHEGEHTWQLWEPPEGTVTETFAVLHEAPRLGVTRRPGEESS